MNKFALRKNLK